MAFSADDLAKLELQIANYRAAVRHGDKAVNHAALNDLIALRDKMIAESKTSTQAGRNNRHLIQFDRGR